MLVSIKLGTVQGETIDGHLFLFQIVDGVDDEYCFLKRNQRVTPFPQCVAYGFRDQRPVSQFQPKTRERGKEGQFHTVHIQLCIHVLVGCFQHYGG